MGFSSFSDLQTNYPNVPYQFDLTGAAPPPDVSIVVSYAGDAYSNVPYVTNFSALAGLDASNPFQVDFNTFLPGLIANESEIFFNVIDSTNTTVFSVGDLRDTTTSVIIPAGTLAAGQTYTFDLVFDNRINGTDDLSGLPVTQFYDTHTDGSFTTAVPEPSTWAMLLIGFVGLGYAGYRGSRKKSAAAVAG